MTTIQPGGGVAARPQPSGLVDVIDTILDKGLVIDAYVRVSLVGIELLTIDARVVMASVDTYLRFAEAVNRLDISQEKEGLPDLVGDLEQSGAKHKTQGVLDAAGDKLRDLTSEASDARRRARDRPPGRPRPAEPLTRSTLAHSRCRTVRASTATTNKKGEHVMATPTQTAVYVYGILPSDVELQEPATGVGDPASPVRLVHYRDIAALISDVDVSRPLGTPEDLLVHEELLDASAAEAPVLPMRFGAVLASEDVVTSELLEANYEEFNAALQQLEGYAEYIVKGRYIQGAILQEILAEDPEARGLAAQTRGSDPVARSLLATGSLPCLGGQPPGLGVLGQDLLKDRALDVCTLTMYSA